MGLFSRFRRTVADVVGETPTYVECRSWNGTAFHIRATSDYSGLALCGYEPLDDRSGITLADLEAREPMQHAGWHYCRACVATFRLDQRD